MRKIQESGRSLLEMLAVLAIIALLVLSSIFFFNSVFKYYQRKDTVKQMDTIVEHYRSEKLLRRRNGEIVLKDIIPSAQGNTLKASDGGEFTLVDSGKNTFVIIKKAEDTVSCKDIISEGNYDVVGYGKAIENYKAPENRFTSRGAQAQLEAICSPNNYQYFYFNKDKTTTHKTTTNPDNPNNPDDPDNPTPDVPPAICDGEICPCPNKDEVKDNQGTCCLESQIECGVCGGCKNGTKCLNDTCVECTEDTDCYNKNNGKSESDTDYKKYVCKQSTHTCVQCTNVGKACLTEAPYSWTANDYCNSSYKCEKCSGACKLWDGNNCQDKSHLKKLNEICEADCECPEGSTCQKGVCQKTSCVPSKEYEGPCEIGCLCDSSTEFVCTEDKCQCPAGKVWDDTNKKCVKGNCPTTLFSKGDSCKAYAAYPDGCCEAGLYCKNDTCQCKTLSKQYEGECNDKCGCDSNELICRSNKCLCPSNKVWNAKEQICECPTDKPFWNEELKKCVECRTEEDCEGNRYCDTQKVCQNCTTTPVPTCSISENEKDEKGCVLKTPFTCPKEGEPAQNKICKNDTTCVECLTSMDCPENKYCTSNNTCAPCGPDGTAIRPKTEAKCRCPENMTIYCGSKSAGYSKNCTEGNYICREGCQQTSDCDPNNYCYKVGNAEFGKCTPCAEGQYRKAEETECHACEGCQTLNAAKDGCVSTCQKDEACLMKSCNAVSSNGTCQITPKNNTWTCQEKPKLIEIKGQTVGGRFYLPPAEDKYRFYQPDAARFCESYGYRLATIQEACGKDWAYDSGHDCKNISLLGLSQYHTTGSGSFWMDARYGANCSALTITYSCGNNHEHNVCGERFFPICTDGSSVKCAKNEECPENFYCTAEGCQECSSDGSAIRRKKDKKCHCSSDQTAFCGGTGHWHTDCTEGEFVCKSGCYQSSECPNNQQCIKENGQEFGQCRACPEGEIRFDKETACHKCTQSTECAENQRCVKNDGEETGLCEACPWKHRRRNNESLCSFCLLCDD